MNIAERRAAATWEGSTSRRYRNIGWHKRCTRSTSVTWAARTEQPRGKTSPEELAAAAHSSCLSMAIALTLGKHQATAKRLAVGSTVTLDEVDGVPTIVSSAITVDGDVPDIDAEQFQDVVNEAAQLCPISRLFAGAAITVETTFRTS